MKILLGLPINALAALNSTFDACQPMELNARMTPFASPALDEELFVAEMADVLAA